MRLMYPLILILKTAFRNKQEVIILNLPSFIAKTVGESEYLAVFKL